MRFALFVFFFLFLFIMGREMKVEACVGDAMQGTWQNVRLETKQLSALEFEAICHEGSSQSELRVRAFEKCRPRDCSWGWTEAVKTERGKMVAVFNTFIAQRRLEITPFGKKLRVRVTTDYINPLRQSDITAHILTR